jgi:acetyl-CoA acyltransferase
MGEREVVLVEGVRTPFAKAGTAMKRVSAAELGRIAVKELIQRSNLDPSLIDDVLIGNAWTPADTVNIGRVIALQAGLPEHVPAASVNRFSASSLEAIAMVRDRIKVGEFDIAVAGGAESMSNMPWLIDRNVEELFEEFLRAKTMRGRLDVLRKVHWKKIRPKVSVELGLVDPMIGMSMGQTAELLAKEMSIGREEQDAYALRSHRRAVTAFESGKLKEEIIPVFLPPDCERVVSEDVGPRIDSNMDALAALEPVFDKNFGSVTAGNSCSITDGAAMVLVADKEKARQVGLKPIAKVLSYSVVGVEPQRMGLGPAYATPVALKKAGLSFSDIGLIEINEAFSAQILACQKVFDDAQFAKERLGLSTKIGEIEDEKLNVNGGAIAFGHPIGATGGRMVISLMREMRRRQVEFGLATLNVGGGQGAAMILQLEE